MSLVRALFRLLTLTKNFGPAVIGRVLWSKIVGLVVPSKRLLSTYEIEPERCMLSVLVVTGEWRNTPGSFTAMVESLYALTTDNWELCICHDSRESFDLNAALPNPHGADPRIKIITVDAGMTPDEAVLWTIEQATGKYVACLSVGCALQPELVLSVTAAAKQTGNYSSFFAFQEDSADKPGKLTAIIIAKSLFLRQIDKKIDQLDLRLATMKKIAESCQWNKVTLS